MERIITAKNTTNGMRWKDVFMIWLWADLLLAAGVIFAGVYINKGSSDDFGLIILVVLYGIFVSLPSLAVMLLFHVIYTKKMQRNHTWPYMLLILCINLIYWLIGTFFNYYTPRNEWTYLILFTTLAGILGFAIISRKIKRRMQHNDAAAA
jgi:hypothetical protein